MKPIPINQSDKIDRAGADMGSTEGASKYPSICAFKWFDFHEQAEYLKTNTKIHSKSRVIKC